ncbi:MAG: hypothetical protein J2P47_02170 [Acetobacteraceae bacterium]|nr:hypothetical protein [Acetobacteraceae bacterium]
MESISLQLQRFIRAAWERRWVALGTAWLICLLGWLGVYMIPNRYESSARLFVDTDAVLTPLLRGVAADTSSMSQLDMLQRTLLSSPNLDKLISKTDLDLNLKTPQDRQNLIRQLESEIKVTSLPPNKTLFTIEYRNGNPRRAYEVVQTLLNIFVENATGANRQDMENARRFLNTQIASYEQQLRTAERRRAEFRTRYLAILPRDDGQGGIGMTRLEQLGGEVISLHGQLQDAINKRDGLKQELAKASATIDTTSPSAGNNGPNRLAEAEEQLRELRLRYTESYPDVVTARHLVASLKAKPPESNNPAAGEHGQAANPGYERMRLNLLDAEAAVSSLTRQLGDATKERDALQDLARQAPAVQAEYKALDRDYEVLKNNYTELLARRESAQIAQAANLQADNVQLNIIDPPQLPTVPISPNRTLLVPAVLVVGLASAVGISVLLSQFDRSFRTIDDLRALGLPVLGGVSSVRALAMSRRVVSTVGFGLGLLALIVVCGGILAHVLRAQAMV